MIGRIAKALFNFPMAVLFFQVSPCNEIVMLTTHGTGDKARALYMLIVHYTISLCSVLRQDLVAQAGLELNLTG